MSFFKMARGIMMDEVGGFQVTPIPRPGFLSRKAQAVLVSVFDPERVVLSTRGETTGSLKELGYGE